MDARPARHLALFPRRSPHGRRRIIVIRLRLAGLLRRHLALALVKIERGVQFGLFGQQFPEAVSCSNGLQSCSR
ncbi:MAG: hypothetical protein ACREX3_15865 [Gammaproteobacteria bacterium]